MSEHLYTYCARYGIDPRKVDRRLLELRALGLSHADIAQVVAYYEGWQLSEAQVYRRLRAMGVRGRTSPRWQRRPGVAA